MTHKFTLLLSLLFFAFNNIYCVHTFTGKILGQNGHRIPNALLYIEAYTNDTYDYAWSISGDSGQIPYDHYPQLKLLMKPGTKLNICVLADGKKPFIINNRQSTFKQGPLNITITDDTLMHSEYNPLLFHLEFPFENKPELQKKLALASQRILIERFNQAYKMAQKNSDDFSPAAHRKMEYLDSLITKLNGK